jgi:hypothetical protein
MENEEGKPRRDEAAAAAVVAVADRMMAAEVHVRCHDMPSIVSVQLSIAFSR